jgi:two-component system sensor histidine kinase YesM
MLLVTNNIVKRMNNLIATLKKVRSGLFHSSISVSGRDEISALERYFNETISELNALIQENSDANSKVMQTELRNQRLLNMNREAEIIVLQHQMDPHYLFNTFETIRMELVRSDSRELAGFVRAFADNVRASLYAGDVMYALGDELNLLNDFIIVQKFRYGDRMIFEISVDPSLLDCRIPKLSIQPLLENAVFHGVEPALGQRSIQIAITRSSDILTVRVHDDGQGIDQQRLTELRDIIYQDEDAARKALNGKCSALRNVHWRSILIYGPDFGITIDSRKGEFTETTLRIRYSNEEKSLGKEGGSLPCTDA